MRPIKSPKIRILILIFLMSMVSIPFSLLFNSSSFSLQFNPCPKNNIPLDSGSYSFDYEQYPEFYDGIAKDFVFSGDLAFLADGAGGIEIFNISDFNQFQKIAEWDIGIYVDEIAILRNIIAIEGDSKNIYILNCSNPFSIDILSVFPTQTYIKELLFLNEELMLYRSYRDIFFVNITDLYHPEKIETPNEFWDKEDFDIFFIQDNLLYFSYDFTGDLQIMNISTPYSPQLLANITITSEENNYLRNIVLFEEAFFIQDIGYNAFLVNISNFNNVSITKLSNFNTHLPILGFYDDKFIVVEYNYQGRQISFYKLTDSLNFVLVNKVLIEDNRLQLGSLLGYRDGIYLLMSTDGFAIYNISNIKNINQAVVFDEDGVFSKIVADKNTLYASSDRGIEIFDFSNPESPKKLAEIEHGCYISSDWFIKVQNKLHLVDLSGYMFSYDVSMPSSPIEIESNQIANAINDFYVSNQFVIMFAPAHSIKDPLDTILIYQIQNTGELTEFADHSISPIFHGLGIKDEKFYYMTGSNKICELDFHNPDKISNKSVIQLEKDCYVSDFQIVECENLAYLGKNHDEFTQFSFNRFDKLIAESDLSTEDYTTFLAYSHYLFIGGLEALDVYDVTIAQPIIRLFSVPISNHLECMTISENLALVLSSFQNGIQWINLPNLDLEPEVISQDNKSLTISNPFIPFCIISTLSMIFLISQIKHNKFCICSI